MKVGLIGPEIEENLALRSIAASLAAAGHEPRIFDFRAPEQIPALADAIVDWAPGLVGFSMIFTARSDEFMELAMQLRARGHGGHLTAGGHFAALHAVEIMRDCPALDSIVHGEGEEPMVDLARDPSAAPRQPGLTVRGASGALVFTGQRPNADDLDSRPWSLRPDRFHDYLGQSIASLLSSRGCWASCHFCSILAFHGQCGDGKRYRQRRTEQVAREMAHLFHERGVRMFNFQDDNFLVPSRRVNLERLRALQASLDDHGVGRIALQVKTRPDCVDEQVVDLLIEMGLFRFFLGIETDAVVGLKTLGRGIEREQNHRALEILRKREVHTCFNLLMFDPESDLESLHQNVDFMRRQSYFPLNFCRVEVYGGTAIEARLRDEGRLIGDYRGYSYAIADPRAQLAYRVFREVFWPRNFGPGGMHHESMKADYTFHVLRHFRPDRASRALERRVKAIVRDINVSSADIMDRVLDLAASRRWDDDAFVARKVAELSASRAAADRSVGRRVRDVVAHMEQLATAPPERRPLRHAAAAAAAAALVVTAPGCRHHEPDTHMCEMAPPPYDLPDGGEGPAVIGGDSAQSTMPANEQVGVAQQLQEWARMQLAPLFEQNGLQGVPVVVDLDVDPQGRVAQCTVGSGGDDAFRRQLCAGFAGQLFAVVQLGGTVRVVLQLGGGAVQVQTQQVQQQQVQQQQLHQQQQLQQQLQQQQLQQQQLQQQQQFDRTHMCEMAPPPHEPKS